MHIPDGFLSLPIALITWILALIVIGYSLWQLREIDERQLSYMGVLGAVIFAAQMLNFPIASGTSGHLAGGALAALIVGPFASVIILTVVLLIQAFMFADGGVTVLGANVLNMGIIGAFVGYYAKEILMTIREDDIMFYVAAFVAGFLGLFVAAIAAAIELGLSGTFDMGSVLIAMAFYHLIIGIGEGAITAAVMAYLAQVDFPVGLPSKGFPVEIVGTPPRLPG
ncbi:MAG: energy-coupling factor ABC transporter permease [Candidatus Thorarchaeota archaeon]